MELENVKRYADAVPTLLDTAEKRFSAHTQEDIASADKMLRPVVNASFEEGAIFSKLVSDLELSSCEDPSLREIANRIAEGNDKLATLGVQQVPSDPVPSKEKIQKLDALANSMTLPALAAENAIAGAAMNVALQAYFTDEPDVLAKRSDEDNKNLAKQTVAVLREKPENLGPFDQGVAKSNLIAQLTWILSTLPDDDINRLTDFYASPETKKLQEDLIDIYGKEIDERSSAMLQNAMVSFKPDLDRRASADKSSSKP